jgi:hypothetical protein
LFEYPVFHGGRYAASGASRHAASWGFFATTWELILVPSFEIESNCLSRTFTCLYLHATGLKSAGLSALEIRIV